MNKGYCALLACFSLSSVFLTSPVFAGNEAGNGTFTLGAGYYHFAPKRNIDNTSITFGSLGYNFTKQWGIEGLLGFFTTDSNRSVDNGKEVNGTLFAMDAIYRFSPIHCFEPYVLAGPGAIGMNPNGNDANVQGNFNAGVGTQYFFSKTIALRLEARDFYTFVGGKNDYFLNGGVSFLF
jgi:OOP family OmpA-OmpF porin